MNHAPAYRAQSSIKIIIAGKVLIKSGLITTVDLPHAPSVDLFDVENAL